MDQCDKMMEMGDLAIQQGCLLWQRGWIHLGLISCWASSSLSTHFCPLAAAGRGHFVITLRAGGGKGPRALGSSLILDPSATVRTAFLLIHATQLHMDATPRSPWSFLFLEPGHSEATVGWEQKGPSRASAISQVFQPVLKPLGQCASCAQGRVGALRLRRKLWGQGDSIPLSHSATCSDRGHWKTDPLPHNRRECKHLGPRVLSPTPSHLQSTSRAPRG